MTKAGLEKYRGRKKFIHSCVMSYRQKENWKLASLEWQPSEIYYVKSFSYCFTSLTSQDIAIKDKLLKMA